MNFHDSIGPWNCDTWNQEGCNCPMIWSNEMKRKLEDYEITTLIEFFEDYIKAIIYERQSDSVESAIDLNRKRDLLVEYIKELANEVR
jgi:hypothetical protein